MPKGIHLSRIELNCVICGNRFSKVGSDTDRKCCSSKCAQLSHRKSPVSYTCLHCGKEGYFRNPSRPQSFCSTKCAATYRNIQMKKNNRENGIWPNPREAKADILLSANGCENCGWNKLPAVLELHHKDLNRKNNHRSNLALLCPTCHTIEHYLTKSGQFQNNYGKRKS